MLVELRKIRGPINKEYLSATIICLHYNKFYRTFSRGIITSAYNMKFTLVYNDY